MAAVLNHAIHVQRKCLMKSWGELPTGLRQKNANPRLAITAARAACGELGQFGEVGIFGFEQAAVAQSAEIAMNFFGLAAG